MPFGRHPLKMVCLPFHHFRMSAKAYYTIAPALFPRVEASTPV